MLKPTVRAISPYIQAMHELRRFVALNVVLGSGEPNLHAKLVAAGLSEESAKCILISICSEFERQIKNLGDTVSAKYGIPLGRMEEGTGH